LEKETDTEKKLININNPLYGKNIVMTGFRDKNLVDILKKLGAGNVILVQSL
jgi:hypothetical protein